MSLKTRTGACTTVQYEDFQAKYDWMDEEGAYLLLLQLPGFKKEQMKITFVHSSRNIKVEGERQLADNKFSRFFQAFSVPQNSDVSNIQARFPSGVLTITIPKATIATPAAPAKPTLEDPAPGSTEEQIKVTYVQSSGTVKVEGKLPSTKNKWVGFSHVFSVPESCNGKELRASLENEVLTIRMPKATLQKKKKKSPQEYAMEIGKDRHTLVKIGVGVVVVAAIGAYISYRHKSSSDA